MFISTLESLHCIFNKSNKIILLNVVNKYCVLIYYLIFDNWLKFGYNDFK